MSRSEQAHVLRITVSPSFEQSLAAREKKGIGSAPLKPDVISGFMDPLLRLVRRWC